MAQTVVLVTTMGEITVELYTEHAPKVCAPSIAITNPT
jgi:peptidyl-prolyl cis-trans isomerase-like 1